MAALSCRAVKVSPASAVKLSAAIRLAVSPQMSLGEAEPEAHKVTLALLPGVKVDAFTAPAQVGSVLSQALTVWAWEAEETANAMNDNTVAVAQRQWERMSMAVAP
jgi:hypothetical protein